MCETVERVARVEVGYVKRVAIITFHNAINYGAILQCYALQNYIERKFNCKVDILDYQPRYFQKVFFDPMKPWTAYGIKNKIKAVAKCILLRTEMKNLSRKHKELHRFIRDKLHLCPMGKAKKNSYDVYIAGSDQIWNLELLGNDTTYLLDFVQTGKKISYAASFKISDVDSYAAKAYEKYLSSFDHISVRESDLQKYLKSQLDINATCVLDPTLLINSQFWQAETSSKPLILDKYLLLYYVNPPEHLIERAFSYAETHNLVIVSLNTLRGKKGYVNCSGATIEEFLNLISHAEVVFTTSFHGMAFSIIFEREFYYEVPKSSYNNNNRLEDLAEKLGLEMQNLAHTNYEKIIWDTVKRRMLEYRMTSESYLIQSFSLL